MTRRGTPVTRRLQGRRGNFCGATHLHGLTLGCSKDRHNARLEPDNALGLDRGSQEAGGGDSNSSIAEVWQSTPSEVFDCLQLPSTDEASNISIIHRNLLGVPTGFSDTPAGRSEGTENRQAQAGSRTEPACRPGLFKHSQFLRDATALIPQLREQFLPMLGVCDKLCESISCRGGKS